MNGATTLSALYRNARQRLTDAGLESAALDARLLAEFATGTTLNDIICRPTAPVDGEIAARLDGFIDRRLAGEPVHRIIGSRAFYGLDLALSPDTLEPRPDTEALVELALPFARQVVAETGRCRIVDLGAGTGAIALALLDQLPEATALLTDISAGALATAQANAGQLGLSGRAEIVLSDWFGAVEGLFDLIVSNPPYIPTAAIAGLSVEVRKFDPLRALDGGTDGLDAYRAIAAGAKAKLAPGGAVAVEIGISQGADVREIFASRGFSFREAASDLAGVERALLFVANNPVK